MPARVPESTWTTPDAPVARPLVDDLARDYDARYEPTDGIPSSAELTRYPVELFSAERGGAFLILQLDGSAVAGGAFIRVDDHTAELKRVWTHPDHRRTGLARRVMAELEQEASRRGYETATLTTGARQPEALGLYLALGYRPLFDLEGDLEQISYLRFDKALGRSLGRADDAGRTGDARGTGDAGRNEDGRDPEGLAKGDRR